MASGARRRRPGAMEAEEAKGPEASDSASSAAGLQRLYRAARPIEVVARHATQGVSVRVTLPHTARFRHLKQALARCLDRPEVQERAVLTSKVRGVYKAHKDDAPIGEVREVTVAAADFGGRGGPELAAVVAEDEVREEAAESDEGEDGGAAAAFSAPRRVPALSSATYSGPKAVPARPGKKASRITKRQAINLQRELCEGFQDEAFQWKLGILNRKANSPQLQKERQELFLMVQSEILPKYGFEGTTSGVYKMMGDMGPFVDDPEFRELAEKINDLLGLKSPPESWGELAKSCQKTEAAPSKESRVRPAASSLLRMIPPGVVRGLAEEVEALDRREADRREAAAVSSGPRKKAEAPPRFDRWPIGKHRPFKLFIAGTWNDFRPAEMLWQNGLFVSAVTVGSNGWESFQMLKEGSWSATIYPSVPDAGPFERHLVCGPDNAGHGKNWQIGRFPEEQAGPGSQFAIVATIDKEACVKLVHWEPI